MSDRTDLNLPESLLLLALRDREGTVDWHAGYYQLALGGAILAELALAARVELEGTRRALVDLLDAAPLGNAELDECLEQVATARRRAAAAVWVARFARVRRLRHRLALGLCRRGVLKADEATILLFFRRRIYPQVDPRPEERLVERLRRAVLGDGSVDARTRVLLGLLNAARMTRTVFQSRELRPRSARLRELIAGESVGRAVRKAVEAVEVAMLAATASV